MLNLYAMELFSGDLFLDISHSQCISVYVFFALVGCKSILQSVYVNGCVICVCVCVCVSASLGTGGNGISFGI